MRLLPIRVASEAPGIPLPLATWRVTTAIRVFGLAIVIGQVLDRHAARQAGVILVGLGAVAVVACAGESGSPQARLRWLSLAEGLMIALIIGLAGSHAETATVYLAVPAVVAGVSHGRIGTTNTWLVTVLGFTAAEAAGRSAEQLPAPMMPAVLWLTLGLAAGLFAAHQARSLRQVEAAHAPYAAAHRLVGQLHTLIRQRPEVLDVALQAMTLRKALHAGLDAERSAVLVRTQNGLELVSSSDLLSDEEEHAGRLCAFYGQRIQRQESVALPLRVGRHVVGAVVLSCPRPHSAARLNLLQEELDEQAIRLETALLVDDVRLVATADERNRLAREIHDGVAQRVVALGYLADEVSAASVDQVTREGAEQLREEIDRLVAELRFSVFDLRQDIESAGGLSAALTDYVRELSAHSPLRVHLTLDEQDTRLPRRTEAEVLRIAQEAIGNVHRHARAINVWVTLQVSGSDVRLAVEDDGVGGAAPRAGHYGMHTMRERAERIDADLEVGTRHDGGTTVTVRSRAATDHMMGAHHDQRLACR